MRNLLSSEVQMRTSESVSCSVMPDSATPRAVAHQAPLSMGILQARILECFAMPPPGDLPNPGIKSRSPALQADSLPSEPPGKQSHQSQSAYSGRWGILSCVSTRCPLSRVQVSGLSKGQTLKACVFHQINSIG